MNIVDRFIEYTKFDTTAFEDSQTCPSNPNEFQLAKLLKKQLLEVGVNDARVADNCFVYGSLASNVEKQCATVGFLAHMDTSDATSGKDIKARLIKNYDGNDIELSDGIYSTVEDYPDLAKLKGKDIIVTDGTTLLGGDDKAGIAIIMDFLEYLYHHSEVKHGNIMICFTPDEEIGSGIHHIDLKEFVCDYAYTLDGGAVNNVTYECFNGASAHVHFYGNSIHPGSAKDKMINACQLAMDFHAMLPVNARPEFTSDYDGFNHMTNMSGDCQQADSYYIIRNHDYKLLKKQMHDFELITMHMNEMYGRQVVELTLKEGYKNMKECFQDKMYIVNDALEVITEMGYNAVTEPIRGGTDGAELSYMGIPTPNLGTGGMNCHGNHELVCVDDMKEMVTLLLKLIQKIANK